jgi:MFS family permease
LGFYKRNRSLFLILLGTGLMATSVFWEYVRVKPDYRYIVQPWSIRGYETTQGWVIFAGALAVLILAIPLSLRLLKGKLFESIVVAALVTAFATLVPVLANAPDQTPGGILIWVFAVLLGLALTALAGRLLPLNALGSWRKLALFGGFAGITALAGLVIYDQLLSGRTVPMWVLMLILMATLDLMVLSRRPAELSSYRLLLLGVTMVWVVALVCAGSLRSTLLGLQIDKIGIAAEYRDIQITSGVLLCWAGGLLAFFGAVALWARRRDELQEHSRAGQQLAVAAISATELEEAV